MISLSKPLWSSPNSRIYSACSDSSSPAISSSSLIFKIKIFCFGEKLAPGVSVPLTTYIIGLIVNRFKGLINSFSSSLNKTSRAAKPLSISVLSFSKTALSAIASLFPLFASLPVLASRFSIVSKSAIISSVAIVSRSSSGLTLLFT